MAEDFTFTIAKNCGVVSEGKGGWKLELNLVSWGDRPPKYDVRSWSPDHKKMSKGVTLTKEELQNLGALISALPAE